MTAFQISLDRYLTSEPQDDFTLFCEQVDEALPNDIWDYMGAHNVAIEADRIYLCLHRKDGMMPERAAKIVARIYRERAASNDTI